MRRAVWLLGLLALALAALCKPVLLAAALVWLLLPPLALLALLPARKRLRLRLDAPAVCAKGERLALRLSAPGGSVFCGEIIAEVRARNAATGEICVKKTGLGELKLSSAYCGGLRCEVRRARLFEPFGVCSVRLVCALTRRVVVLPDTFPVLLHAAPAPNRLSDGQDYAPDRRGDDPTEPFQLRDYVPGDPLSQIHWKLSSKRGGLIVREASLPADRSLLLLVDRADSPADADALLETAASLAQALCQAGLSFDLEWNGRGVEQREIAEAGQLPEALAALLCAQPEENLSAAETYLRTCGAPRGGRLGYLGSGVPACLAQLTASVPARVLVCGGDAPPENGVAFAPENAAEIFREFDVG